MSRWCVMRGRHERLRDTGGARVAGDVGGVRGHHAGDVGARDAWAPRDERDDARGECAGKETEEDVLDRGRRPEGVFWPRSGASAVDIGMHLCRLLSLHACPCLRDLGMLGEQLTPLARNCFRFLAYLDDIPFPVHEVLMSILAC